MTYDNQFVHYIITAFILQKSKCLFIAPQWLILLLLLWRESQTGSAN